MTAYRWLAPLLACVALAGCTATIAGMKQDIASLFHAGEGRKDLDAGVRAYEDANYRQAARLIQAGIDSGLGTSDKVRAHKYLAFIHCVSGQLQQCRDEFGKALDLDPSFDLREDEAGHPIWGPAFRSVKSRR
jgi:predicted small secreted protein